MIIDTVKGDLIALFKQGNGHLIHGCNCFHTMGAGIAAKIAKEFPQALEIDKQTSRGKVEKLGGFSVWTHQVNGYNWCGVNLYTQFRPGPNAEYGAILKGFETINDVFEGAIQSFYIPKIGCGIGGLEWECVEEIINIATPDINIVVVEYDK